MGFHSAHVTKILLESTVASMKVGMKMCFPQNLVVLARILPNRKANILYVSFLPASHPSVHVVEFQKTHSNNFIKLCVVVPFIQLHCFLNSNQTERKCYPLFRPVCVFFFTSLSYENRNSFFCKNFILCD